ncbi:hypothetical protein P1X14_13400 [Sphingomonas sp. AOB5]|uniref:cobaltochelatase CobT-related protein n=1 Tax=Sphingomonas sp. AOB5 TaxID=3034017 RepID=UPI0023FA24B9|nr:hypothetical protein [Sphingomonas sp. AOB5]MDF7776248.1 hypothetical protein [Sphingomonas sp. AOB5]
MLALVALAILWDSLRKYRANKQVPDGPEDEPYRIWSRAHDLELRATDIPARLRDASADFYEGWSDRRGTGWAANRSMAEACAADQPPPGTLVAVLANALQVKGAEPDEFAVTLLIDQSGSMKGAPIAATAAAIAAVSTALSQLGIRHEILGFSTAGWRGGFAFRDWRKNGMPARPGRLCALLHVVWKAMDEPEWTAESQRAFVHPDVLRENVDGEALEWAAARLTQVPAGRRLLVILSDGAPVDDATIMHNGPCYLVRHLRRTIATAETAGEVELAAIGIGYRVSDYYGKSREAGLESIAATTTALLADLI